jgi:hypothetical protein
MQVSTAGCYHRNSSISSCGGLLEKCVVVKKLNEFQTRLRVATLGQMTQVNVESDSTLRGLQNEVLVRAIWRSDEHVKTFRGIWRNWAKSHIVPIGKTREANIHVRFIEM